MSDRYLWQSPLAHLGLEARAVAARGDAGVALAERPFRTILNLRGQPNDAAFMAACTEALGLALPVQANTTAGKDGVTAFWLGPNEWWVVAPEDAGDLGGKLRTALGETIAAVTEVSDSRTCIAVSGPRARDLLLKGCPLDLHPRSFAAGQCAQSLIAKAGVTIHQVSDAPAYELYVVRSFADYLWRWLEDAAREFGVAVVRD